MTQKRHHLGVYASPAIAALAIAALIYVWASADTATVVHLVFFAVALAALAFGFLDMLIRDIRHSYHYSIQWRMVIVAVMIVETVLLFAFTYLTVSELPDEITGMRTVLDAVYFTMTTLLTIGFGDIAAEGQLARGVVLTQMLFTILVLSASVRLFTSLVRTAAKDAGSRHPGNRRHDGA